jgi:isoleucyl-tRNA synthetase
VRRSRERFWATEGVTDDARDAFDTLYTVLETVAQVAAPLLPLTSEEIWRGLTGGRSVHLLDWPSADDLPGDAGPRREHGQGPRGGVDDPRAPEGAEPAGAASRCRH